MIKLIISLLLYRQKEIMEIQMKIQNVCYSYVSKKKKKKSSRIGRGFNESLFHICIYIHGMV